MYCSDHRWSNHQRKLLFVFIYLSEQSGLIQINTDHLPEQIGLIQINTDHLPEQSGLIQINTDHFGLL